MDGIEGVTITPLKIIEHPKGNILHALKKSEEAFIDFGEAYFSTVIKGEKKGWKKHLRMTLNIVVPVGEIKFILYDERPDSVSFKKKISVTIGAKNYQRITVPPGVWMAFSGMADGLNLLLNLASVEHDPAEAESRDIDHFTVNWEG